VAHRGFGATPATTAAAAIVQMMATGETRRCPACGGSADRELGEVNGFGIVRCGACGTLFTDRLPAEPEVKDYTDYYHAANLAVPAFVHARLREIVGEFATYRRTNRWLDVGCGAGTLLSAASELGWTAVGTELSPPAVDAARVAGLDMRLGELAALGFAPGEFDVVSLVEVLEHVPEPRTLLAEVTPLIRPGGALYLTTPHVRGIDARLLGSDWGAVAPPEHLQLFSVRGMRSALESCGLRVRRVRTHGVNPNELVTALRPGRKGTAPTGNQRVEATYQLNESLSARRGGAIVKDAVNAVLTLTRLGDTLKMVAERPEDAS
jgi:SAM-dependent methyltransferase